MCGGHPLSTLAVQDRETAASGNLPGVVVCDDSDEMLAERASRGDRSAFATLVVRWESRLYRFVYVRLRCEHDASEVTQEAFMRAWRAMPRYHVSSLFSTWLFAIAHREIVNVVRRRQKDTRDSRREQPESFQRNDIESLQDVWLIARNALDDSAFDLVWLRYAEDMEPKQIARVTGKSSVAIRVQLHRARAKLATALGSYDTKSEEGEVV